MATELFSISEAAQLIGCYVGTLRKWDDTGKLPARRIAGRRLYTQAMIERGKKIYQPKHAGVLDATGE